MLRYHSVDKNVIDTKTGQTVKKCRSDDEADMYAQRYNLGKDSPKREETADDRGYEEDSFGYNYKDWN